MVTGGITRGQAQKSIGDGRNPSNTNTDAISKNTETTKKNTDEKKKEATVFDWVAQRLTYFGNKTKEIADKITDYISSALKTTLLKKQMKAVDKEIAVNTKASETYESKAKSAGKKLPKSWIDKIKKGDYTIQEINDSGLADRINAYKDWYDKAQDCKQAVQDLKNTQLELFEQWLNMPTEKAEKAIEKLSKKYNILNAQISTITSGGSATAQLQKLQSASYASAQSNLEKAQGKKAEAKAKSQKAKSKFNSAKSTLKKSKLTKAEKKAVKSNKKVNTKGLSGTKKKRVEAYNAALTQKKKATSNYSSAKSDYTTASSYAGALRSSLSGSTSYEVANSLIDEQLNNQRKQDAEYQKALKDSQKNVTDTKATRDSANTKVKNKGSSISKKYSKKLSKAQKDALASGKTVSLKGITDKKLKKQLEEYNKLVTQSKTATTQYNMALDAQSTAAENAATSQAELAQALVDADVAKLENISNFYDAQKSYTDAQASAKQSAIDLKQAKGEKVTEADYRAQMGYNNQNINTLLQKKQKLEAQLANSSTIKPNSEEWYKIKAEIEGVAQEINNCEINNEELKDSIRNAKYKEMFENALEAVDKFKTALSTVRDLINEDMMYDDNGGLTEYGLTALATYVKDLESSESKIQTLLAERRQLDADLKNAASGLSEDEYKEAVKANEESLQNELKSMNSSRQAILSIMKEQAKAELDAINEVIDARKEALQKKKEYYDYDKTLKSKTKEIQLLKQQIAALDGMADAESRAKKARLEAQLAEKNDDLNDTVREHVYQLEVDGLTDLTKELQENYDDYVKELGRTLESIEKAVGNATNTVVGALGDVSSTVAAILKSYGINDPKSIGITSNLTGAANGGYVKGIIPAGDDGLAGVRIGEEVVVPEVVQELRKMLPTLQRSSELMFADSVKVDLQSLKAASNSGIGDINLHYDAMVSIGQIDGSSKDIVAQIEKAMPNISKRVINDLRKDARKKGLK